MTQPEPPDELSPDLFALLHADSANSSNDDPPSELQPNFDDDCSADSPEMVPLLLASVPRAYRTAPRPRRRRRLSSKRRKRISFVPLLLTIGTFAAMMCVSIIHIAYSIATLDDLERMKEPEILNLLIFETSVVETIDAALVIGCVFLAGWPRFRQAYGAPPFAWIFAPPGFVFCLLVNVGYSLAIQAIFKPDEQQEVIDLTLSRGVWPWAILLVCVQPAVIEELFFRGLLLGHLRHHLGVHGAVWLSSILFGVAHLGNPVGWPVLTLIGVGLGYARYYSGGLTLPMILHFCHNLAVISLDEWVLK